MTFVELDEATIRWYLSTGEPAGKAGAYALQGAGAVLVASVDGSVSNVIGLPMHLVVQLAAHLGVELLASSALGVAYARTSARTRQPRRWNR